MLSLSAVIEIINQFKPDTNTQWPLWKVHLCSLVQRKQFSHKVYFNDACQVFIDTKIEVLI